MSCTLRRLASGVGLAVLVLTGCGNGPLEPGDAAVVGQVRISTDEHQQLTTATLAVPDSLGVSGGTPEALRRTVLSRLVGRELLEVVAAERGVTVSDGDVDRLIAEQVEIAGSRQALDEQFERSQRLPASELEATYREWMLTEVLAEQLVADVDVPRSELQALYEERFYSYERRRMRHIVVDDEALARDLLAQVQADPGRFAELAAANSTNTSTAPNGGVMGLLTREGYSREFQDVMFSLPIGEFALAQEEQGWHVLQSLEQQTTTLAEVTPELRRVLLEEKANRRLSAALIETGKRVGVTVNPRIGRWDPEQAGLLEPRLWRTW